MGVPDAATAFKQAITDTLIQRECARKDDSIRGSITRFAAKLFPLIKVLLDVGGVAAQVVLLLSGVNFSRRAGASQRQWCCGGPFSLWRFSPFQIER